MLNDIWGVGAIVDNQRQVTKSIRSWVVCASLIILLGGTALAYNLIELAANQLHEESAESHFDEVSEPLDSLDTDAEGLVKVEQITYRIVIDAGHGGRDPGATGVSGHDEKEFTLSLAQKIVDILAEDPTFEPYMTRSDDTFIDLQERAEMANQLGADALISIHGNTFTDPKVNGTETYYWTDQSIDLAQAIHEQLVLATNLADRGIRKSDWVILKHSEVPAVLAEIGYMTNIAEERWMLSEDGQDLAAQAIVRAIRQYFTLNAK